MSELVFDVTHEADGGLNANVLEAVGAFYFDRAQAIPQIGLQRVK